MNSQPYKVYVDSEDEVPNERETLHGKRGGLYYMAKQRGESESTEPKGKGIKGFLTTKTGPLENWQWGAVGGVALAIILYLKARSSSASPTNPCGSGYELDPAGSGQCVPISSLGTSANTGVPVGGAGTTVLDTGNGASNPNNGTGDTSTSGLSGTAPPPAPPPITTYSPSPVSNSFTTPQYTDTASQLAQLAANGIGNLGNGLQQVGIPNLPLQPQPEPIPQQNSFNTPQFTTTAEQLAQLAANGSPAPSLGGQEPYVNANGPGSPTNPPFTAPSGDQWIFNGPNPGWALVPINNFPPSPVSGELQGETLPLGFNGYFPQSGNPEIVTQNNLPPTNYGLPNVGVQAPYNGTVQLEGSAGLTQGRYYSLPNGGQVYVPNGANPASYGV